MPVDELQKVAPLHVTVQEEGTIRAIFTHRNGKSTARPLVLTYPRKSGLAGDIGGAPLLGDGQVDPTEVGRRDNVRQVEGEAGDSGSAGVRGVGGRATRRKVLRYAQYRHRRVQRAGEPPVYDGMDNAADRLWVRVDVSGLL